MNAITLTSLTAILGREIEEVVLTAAKASAMGLDAEIIANSIGIERHEIEELMQGQDYKDVRLLVGADMLKERTDRDTGWDGVESEAVRKLGRRVTLENDTDTLLRIAAVANRATRRTAPPKEAGPLDPSQAGARIPLTLTRRFTERLGADGSLTRSETRQISVLDGSAVNPKFEDVRRLLSDSHPQSGQSVLNASGSNPDEMATQAKSSFVEEPKRSPAMDYIERVSDEGSKPFSLQELMAAARRSKK